MSRFGRSARLKALVHGKSHAPQIRKTLRTDPIRLSSHRGEVVRRIDMQGDRTKRDKALAQD